MKQKIKFWVTLALLFAANPIAWARVTIGIVALPLVKLTHWLGKWQERIDTKYREWLPFDVYELRKSTWRRND